VTRGALALAGAALAAACLAGCSGSPAPVMAQPRPEQAPAAPQSLGTGGPAPGLERYRAPRRDDVVAAPVRLRIPSIGVDTALEGLGRAADLTVEVPSDPAAAGWYAEGVRPGEPGPAVLLGHVDSESGPAVFFRLRELRPGDPVLVDREDGSVAAFTVTRSEQYPKAAFPSDQVYVPTLSSELRLVTCGGVFDRRTGHYRDNVIVSASADA
jgi:sortase (surface protein transpeptidase)